MVLLSRISLKGSINSLHFPERAPVFIKHRPIAFVDENGGGPGHDYESST
jgi:hypothetical protein